jgi:outer membrane lipoprotein SlyB
VGAIRNLWTFAKPIAKTQEKHAMEANTKRLHPLLTAAAVSLTIFSAVGVAAISGLIPHSKGQAKDETPVAAVAAPAPTAEPAPVAQAAPVARSAKPAAKKQVARHTPPVPAPKPAQTVAYNEAPVTPVAQAPQTIEAPKPVLKPGTYGVVESVRQVELKGDAKGVGAVGGAVAGAVLGHNIGEHNKLVTILGAAGGGLLGNQIEKTVRTEKVWDMTVRYDDGSTQSFQSKEAPFWHQGDRVRLYEGKLQPV